LLERVTRPCKLLIDESGRRAGQVGMRPGVIADQVTFSNDPANQRGLLFGKAANHEESSMRAVAGQDVQ